uniref:Uncharacterized protein n=1 Tax=Clytia hemisphaerica TaxID=252671 RepID=A0A7M5VHA1_9CNID|eukprot:TCONS_00063993-protein
MNSISSSIRNLKAAIKTNETTKKRQESARKDNEKQNAQDKTTKCRQPSKVYMDHVKLRQSSFLKEQMDLEELFDKTPYKPNYTGWINKLQEKENDAKKRENLVADMKKWYSKGQTRK